MVIDTTHTHKHTYKHPVKLLCTSDHFVTAATSYTKHNKLKRLTFITRAGFETAAADLRPRWHSSCDRPVEAVRSSQ